MAWYSSRHMPSLWRRQNRCSLSGTAICQVFADERSSLGQRRQHRLGFLNVVHSTSQIEDCTAWVVGTQDSYDIVYLFRSRIVGFVPFGYQREKKGRGVMLPMMFLVRVNSLFTALLYALTPTHTQPHSHPNIQLCTLQLLSADACTVLCTYSITDFI
jgi:hypothetical protein